MGHMKNFDIRIRQGGDDAIAAVSEYVAGRWIPVGERLPEDGVAVLAWLPCDERACAGCLRDGYWCSPDVRLADYPESGDPEGPTHWMPLPEPPAA